MNATTPLFLAYASCLAFVTAVAAVNAEDTTEKKESKPPHKMEKKRHDKEAGKSEAGEEGLQKQAKITKGQAEATALKRVPGGKVNESELEKEDGKLIWSVDLSWKNKIKEVHVDALSGKVVKVETETKEQEAKERAAEREGASDNK